jgi:metal-sulfur cluster biosynthetic enzyme
MMTEPAKNDTQGATHMADPTIREKMQAQKEAFLAAQPSDKEMQALVIEHLKQIYDPELPVDIYNLGLIYEVVCHTDAVSGMKRCHITMTLTSATCSMSDVIVDLVKSIANRQEGLEEVEVEIVFDPPWSQESMTDEAKLAMGLL